MGKIIRQICNLIGSLILVFCIIFCLVGCSDKEKKYDVSFKIKNSEGSTWIFTPDVDELKYEFAYTGKEMRFWVDSWNLPNHPRWSNDWFEPNTSGPNVFQSSLGKIGQMYYEDDPEYVCERGEYFFSIYADSTSDLWISRTVFLYITVI